MSIISQRSPARNVYLDGAYYVAEDNKGVMQEKDTSFSTVFNNSVGDLGDGKINLAPVTYSVDARLEVDETYITVEGEGWGTLLSLANDVDDHVIRLSANNCFIKNLRIYGNNANNAGTIHGLYVYRSAGHRIENLKIYDCEVDDIHIGESTWQACLGGKISGCYIGDTTNQTLGNGVYMDYSATDWEVYMNVIASHRQSGMAGLAIDGDNNNFSGNHLWGNWYNYRLAQNSTLAGMHLHGDKCMDNMYHGIYAADELVKNSVITGCYFWRQGESSPNQDSINFTGATVRSVAIVGNCFRGEVDVGTHQARYAAILDASNTYCTFVGNVIEGYTNAAGYLISDASCEVDHNTVYDCG